MIKIFLKENLPLNFIKKIAQLNIKLKGWYYKDNLNKLAILHHSDKFGEHFYTPHYQKHFQHLKSKKNNILEIGVGGYKHPFEGGNSLRMWKDFFRKSSIYAIDLFDKSKLEEKRIKIFKGDQSNTSFLKEVVDTIGEIDIIIDDGSHVNSHVITTFNFLFPFLKNGGIYVIEDLQTSYWPSFGGNSKDLNDKKTSMNYFKSLVDGLNYAEFMIEGYKPSYLDKNIVSIHFYHNMVFILKGENNEGSNYLVDNKIPS